MSKQLVCESNAKIFNIDIDSLLSSEFLDDEKDYNLSALDSWNSIRKPKSQKSLKSTNSVKTEPSTKREKFSKRIKTNEAFTFLETVRKDFGKSLQIKKNRLTQFTKKISCIYETKINQMIKSQQEEFEIFKREVANSIKEEFSKFENEFLKMKEQESKIGKILEQQIKIIHKSCKTQREWMEHFSDIHKTIIEDFEKLRGRQRNKALELSKSINEEISDFQNHFLKELKADELLTMKKRFTNFYL